jgi:hypothetical protein
MQREQTWDLLEEALGSIEYGREPLPAGYDRFKLTRVDADNYAVLNIYTYNPNTYKPGKMRLTRHEFVVPVATYNYQSWVRWVFDRIVSIEVHETTEFFFVEGHRLYGPHHGNGWDPYAFWPGHDQNEKFKSPGED